MAYPIVPPPSTDAAALLFPRQSQRWLDVNRISRLTLASAWFTIPAFSVAVNWKGYSEIVAAYPYVATNNFSLTTLVGELPSSPNYVACVMWVDGSNKVYRYALWRGIGEVVYFDMPLYTGQLIKKNFRIEIWSVNSTPAVQASDLKLYTSVLSSYDYRYQSDGFSLANAGAIVTDFQAPITAPIALPADTIHTAKGSRYLASYGVTNSPFSWLSVDNVDTCSSSTAIGGNISINGNIFKGVDAGANFLFGSMQGQADLLYVAFQFKSAGLGAFASTLVTLNTGYSIGIGNLGNFYMSINGTFINNIPFIEGELYLLAIFYGTSGYVYRLSGQAGLIKSFTLPNISIDPSTTILALGGTSIQLLDILPYLSLQAEAPSWYQQVLNYYLTTYNPGYTLPLTFPTPSVPILNP